MAVFFHYFEQPRSAEVGDDLLARGVAVEAAVFLWDQLDGPGALKRHAGVHPDAVLVRGTKFEIVCSEFLDLRIFSEDVDQSPVGQPREYRFIPMP
nr:C380 [uncultured bacterium]